MCIKIEDFFLQGDMQKPLMVPYSAMGTVT